MSDRPCCCKACLTVRLNPEPTQIQLAAFRRHKAAGTSPGNPKWYKPPVIAPFKFRGGPPVYPRLPTGADWRVAHDPYFLQAKDPFAAAAKYEDTAGYVRAYNEAVGFRVAA